MEPEQHGTSYVEMFSLVVTLLNEWMSCVLQEHPEYRILYKCTISQLVKENENLKHKLDEALGRINSLEKRLIFYKSSLSINRSDVATVLVQAYSDLAELRQDEECHSLLRKFLTEEILDNLIELKTETFSSTLLDCTQAGLLVHSSCVGLFAADPECYDVFAPLFEPIIHDCHRGLKDNFVHPESDWGIVSSLSHSDEIRLYIEKCMISCSRSLEFQPFFPKMNKKQYIYVMETVRAVLENFCGKFAPGSFYALEAVDEDTKARLKGEGFMFDEGDEAEQAAGSTNYWPTGRAVYVSQNKSFFTNINHKHHIQFGCIRRDGDMKKTFEQMAFYGKIFEDQLPCVRHPKYGWLTPYPTLLGNGMEIRARIRLKKLPVNVGKFEAILKESNLKLADQVITSNYIFCDLRNTRCIGVTEFDAMQAFIAGIENIIRNETEM